MYTRVNRRRQRLGSFEGMGVSRLGDQFGEGKTSIDTGKKAAGGFLDFIKAVTPGAAAVWGTQAQHAHDKWLIEHGINPPSPSQGQRAVVTSENGGTVPIFIGLGALAVVLWFVFGRKKG